MWNRYRLPARLLSPQADPPDPEVAPHEQEARPPGPLAMPSVLRRGVVSRATKDAEEPLAALLLALAPLLLFLLLALLAHLRLLLLRVAIGVLDELRAAAPTEHDAD